ncbi:MAG: hypothetical protein MI717_01130 [Spirochaetales bacterium]|nr:hypothetical protein [Spirochaetales bacterium]
MARNASFLILLFLFFTPLFGQTNPKEDTPLVDAPSKTTIPRDYRGIELGSKPEVVKEQLRLDGWFYYRGEADVTLLEGTQASLIDAEGTLFLTRGLFQFEENGLSTIVLELNPETVDWYTVFTTLSERYGEPTEMNPQRAWWEDEQTRVAIERPLTVKYLDLNVYASSQEKTSNRQAWREKAREEFLNEF